MLKIDKSPDSQHVRDCMTWHYGYSAKERTQHSSADPSKDRNNKVFGGTKYATGYTFNPSSDVSFVPEATYGYNNNIPPNNLDQKECQQKQEKAIDALRGWPGDGTQPDLSNFDRENQNHVEPIADPNKDPYMADLMAHAYMKSKAKQRDGSANTRPNLKSGGKPTRTSVMRHIANNEKAHPVENELWKMSKFTKGAKSALNTRKTPSGGKAKKKAAPEVAGEATGISLSGYGFESDFKSGAGECTCGRPHEEHAYDTAQPYTYTSPDAMTCPPAQESSFKLPPISSNAAQEQAYTFNYTGNNYDRPPSNGTNQVRFSPEKEKRVSFEVAL